MTRRQAVVLGAAAGIGAASAGPGGLLSAAVAGASGGTSGGATYLRRSAYTGRIGQQFAAGGEILVLTAVTDVLGAATDPDLAGHEDAFALEFAGRADALPGETYELFHPQLGPFSLFLSPVGAVAGLVQTYGITVDRSVRLKHVPGPPSPTTAPVASRPAAATHGDDAPAPPLSPRDEEVVAAREAAAVAPARKRRKAALRTDARIRRTRANRVRFKRKKRLERKRLARSRGGWLSRHGR
jgi:hypothetical protein